jgi:hypothetical protein
MNTFPPLSVEEASRLAVTAAVVDLEEWARSVAVHGKVDLDDLVGVLDILRCDSLPQEPAVPVLATLSAS